MDTKKKVRELLKSLKIGERADDIWAFQKESDNLTYDQSESIKRFSCFLHDDRKKISEAIALLDDEPCKTCGGKGLVVSEMPHDIKYWGSKRPCPDCAERSE